MTDKDFSKLRENAKTVGFSQFAEWMLAIKGYRLTRDGKQIDKWEAWELGFRNASKLKNNLTPIECLTQQEFKILMK